jgi:hypothetical protein
VAAPVSVATFPIGSADASCAGAAAGVAAGVGAGAGCVCANLVEPETAPKAAGISSASIGDGTAKPFAVPASMKQPKSQIASGSRCVITAGSILGWKGTRGGHR